MPEPKIDQPSLQPSTSQQGWLHAVRDLIEHSHDLQHAFDLVARAAARQVGPGLALWIGHPDNPGGGYPVKACADLSDAGEPVAQITRALRAAPVSKGILVDTLVREKRSLESLAGDSPDATLGDEVRRFQSLLSVPMLSCSGHLGWFRYLTCRPVHELAIDLEALTLYVNLFSSQVANHRYVSELHEARGWIEKEIAKIAGIQRALMPEHQPPIAGLESAVSFRAFGHAGGDYYDLVPLPDIGKGFDKQGQRPRWGVILADASGHGAAAAVEVAMLDAILRTYPGPAQGPAAVLAYANRHLFTRRLRGTFITAFVANYSRSDKTLSYASAGHNPALLLRAGSTGELLTLDQDGGVPLLITRDAVWQDVQVPTDEGDILVLYTDGIPETRNANGEEFGMERLTRVVRESRPNPKSIVTAIEMAVDDFRDGVNPRDDQTLVVLRVVAPD